MLQVVLLGLKIDKRSELCCSYNQEIHDQISTEIGNNDTMAGLSRSLELEALLQAGHPDATLAGNILGHQLFSGAPLTRLARTLTVIQGPQQARPLEQVAI